MKHLSNFRILALILLNLIPGFAAIDLLGQDLDYIVEKVPITHEISGFSGTCMAQDKEGFMWFGTGDGLWRYDGKNFKIYRRIPGDPKSLQYDPINHIIVDREGILWVSNGWGLHKFCKETETFQRYFQKQTDPPTIMGDEGHLLESADGYIWVSYSNFGVSRFDKSTETFRNYRLIPEEGMDIPSYASVDRIYEDHEGTLWIQHGHNGLSKIMKGKDSIELVCAFPCGLKAMLEDHSGRFWVTSYCGLYELDRESNTFKRYLDDPADPQSLKSQMVRAIMEDSQYNIWIRTYDGLYKYNQQLELLFYLKHSRKYFSYGPYFQITNYLYEDMSGAVWFFTVDGISKIIQRYNNFTIHKTEEDQANFVRSSYLDKNNNIWWSTLEPGTLFRYSPDKSLKKFMIGAVDYLEYSSLNDHITDICPGNKGKLWFSTKKGGIFYKTEQEDTIRLEKDYMSLIRNYKDYYGKDIRNIMEDRDGRLWILVRKRGPFYYDVNDKSIVFLHENPDLEVKLNPIHPMHIMQETETNDFLAAGQSGLYKIITPLVKVSDTSVIPTDLIMYRSPMDESESNIIKHIISLYTDVEGTIWLGTSVSGVIGISEKDNPDADGLNYTIKHFTVKDGLSSNNIRSVIKDGGDNLWLGTTNGLTRFNLITETSSKYFTRHGLSGNLFIYDHAVKSNTGELYFPNQAGMISFHPDSIKANPYVPPVFLTDFYIGHESVVPGENSVLQYSISHTDSIELQYDQNDLIFEFAALSYIHPFLNQYKHKMEGFDDQWVYTGSMNLAEYTNLKPGKYIFKAAGSNNDGIWNEEGVHLNIRIHPPPWLAWYAYLTYGLLFAGGCLGFVRFQKNRARMKLAAQVERIEKEKVLELDHLKSRFFANISHEFRTPLTLILGPLEKLQENRSGLVTLKKDIASSMKRNARRLLQLINQLLDISKLEMGEMAIQVSEGDLVGFVRTIILSFLSLAESKKISYTYELPETAENFYFDADKLEKILTNLISNAFKYTPSGRKVRIEMNTLLDEDQAMFAEFKIMDTGKGIPAENLEKIFDRFYQVNDSDTRESGGTGIGLALTKEIVEQYRGKIHVESKVGWGSTFTVLLPVSRHQFSDQEINMMPSDQPVYRSDTPDNVHMKPEPEGEEVMPGIETSEDMVDTPIVLIVEDNPELLNYVSHILGEKYRILRAENGREGLELAIENIPDIIISDVMMPEMDGMQMCKRLKQDKRTNHIPVIILTAKEGQENRIAGLENGAMDYLVKPFDPDELEIRIRNLIEQRKILWQNFEREFITKPDLPGLPSPDDQLLKKIIDILNQHLAEPGFNADQLSEKLNMSRMQMFRKVNALTGHTPMEMLRTIRLKKAASMFENGYKNIAQVMYEVGFNNQSYFARCFRKLYKVNPSEYLKERIL